MKNMKVCLFAGGPHDGLFLQIDKDREFPEGFVVSAEFKDGSYLKGRFRAAFDAARLASDEPFEVVEYVFSHQPHPGVTFINLHEVLMARQALRLLDKIPLDEVPEQDADK
jgi:hypothetical protein